MSAPGPTEPTLTSAGTIAAPRRTSPVLRRLLLPPLRVPGSPGERRVFIGAAALAAALVGVWLAMEPRTADFAAAAYRAGLYARHGFELWDNNWFDGHVLPGYSLLFPPLAALLGTRVVGALAALTSALLFSVLVRDANLPRSRHAGYWFAAAATGDLFIGRLTFALGVAFGLATVLALTRRRFVLAALLGAACSAASPVAGLFLGLVAVCGWTMLGPARAAILGGPALVMAVLMGTIFSAGGGYQPFDLAAMIADTIIVLLVAYVADGRLAIVRRGALVYAGLMVLCYFVPSPMGSNIARFGVLLAGPLLVLATRDWRRPAVLAACAAIAIWQLWAPVTEVAKTMDNPSTSPSYFAPLNGFLERAGASSGRVEVVPTATRWESVYVADRFALARGWETQLDERYNKLFYTGVLTPEAYRSWLLANGVRFVALPDVVLERWGQRERQLLQHPPSYLRLVWHNANWRVFKVDGAASLVDGPARLVGMGLDGFTVRALRPGPIEVRVHYNSFLNAQGPACVQTAADGWTLVNAFAAGDIHVGAKWSLSAALGSQPPCAGGKTGGVAAPQVAG